MIGTGEKHVGLAILILTVGLLGGCGTTTKVNTCEWVKPILPSVKDQLTRGTKEQILVHNETWEELLKEE